MVLRFGIAVLVLLFAAHPLELPARSNPAVRAPRLQAAAFVVRNQRTEELLLSRRADTVLPIASITKLMTAMVILDARLDLEEMIVIGEADKDTLRHSQSRLPIGTRLTRGQALQVALMASENRAALALGRTFPSGVEGLVRAMNLKAQAMGLTDTRFEDPTGLSGGNISSALDLGNLADQACRYPQIRDWSTREELVIRNGKTILHFGNTNPLVSNSGWNIGLSKTGYIQVSGSCLVLQARLAGEPILVVLLDSPGKDSRIEDVRRIRQWLEKNRSPAAAKKK